MTIECKKKDAAIILIVVGCVAVIVSWIICCAQWKEMNAKNEREEQ